MSKLLLQGLTSQEFLVFYLVGIGGILIRFLINLSNGIKFDKTTPYKFEFKYFIKGLIRIIISFAIMAVVVARFHEFSPQLIDMDVIFSSPTRLPAGVSADVSANITAGTAFVLGLGIDEVVKRIVSTVKK